MKLDAKSMLAMAVRVSLILMTALAGEAQSTSESELKSWASSLNAARKPEEQKALLAKLGKSSSPKALPMIEFFLYREDLRQEALDALYAVAGRVAKRHPDTARAALLKVAKHAQAEDRRRDAEARMAQLPAAGPSTNGGWEGPFFDGATFEGWRGNLEHFRIEDGAIVGGGLDAALPNNEFLTTVKTYGDFELRLKVKMVGEKVNGGIQLRSKRIPFHHEMIGYQADMATSRYMGCLYDESRRRKVLAGPEQEALNAVVKWKDWNEYVIRCEGPRIQLWLNGLQTVDYTEEDESIERSGYIAVQIHGGPPSETWYKDLVITELPKKP